MTTLKEHLIVWPTLIVLGVLMYGLIYGIHVYLGDSRPMYNCSIAEISPDYTPAMKEECRRLRSQKQ